MSFMSVIYFDYAYKLNHSNKYTHVTIAILTMFFMEGRSVTLPWATSSERHSVWPFSAALCKGVFPSCHFNSWYGWALVDITNQRSYTICVTINGSYGFQMLSIYYYNHHHHHHHHHHFIYLIFNVFILRFSVAMYSTYTSSHSISSCTWSDIHACYLFWLCVHYAYYLFRQCAN